MEEETVTVTIAVRAAPLPTAAGNAREAAPSLPPIVTSILIPLRHQMPGPIAQETMYLPSGARVTQEVPVVVWPAGSVHADFSAKSSRVAVLRTPQY